MIIQFVKFKSGLSDAEVQRVMKERAPQFRALPGLVQKYYGHEKQTGEFTGVYYWDSEQSMREFQQTELARTIPAAYKVESPPRIEFFEVLFPLRG
jgi:heme-degrading monooxygenase HmoA